MDIDCHLILWQVLGKPHRENLTKVRFAAVIISPVHILS